MELNYDWRNFQSLFYAKKRLTQVESKSPGRIYLVVEGKVITAAFSEGEDLLDWHGATYDEVAAEFPHRDLVLYDREKVDEWMDSAVSRPHFYDQIQYLQGEATPQVVARSRFKNNESLIQRHFLLRAIQSWWQKLFPSTYGVFIQISEGNYKSNLFIMVQRGRLGSFYVPDLSGMIPERKKHASDVVKYLSERYLVPVQGIFVTASEWAEWSEMANPWPKILSALKKNRTKLTPSKWSLAGLVALRAYFGI